MTKKETYKQRYHQLQEDFKVMEQAIDQLETELTARIVALEQCNRTKLNALAKRDDIDKLMASTNYSALSEAFKQALIKEYVALSEIINPNQV